MTDAKAFIETENCLLRDERPSINLRKMSRDDWPQLSYFGSLLKLKDTGQSPVYHPEGSVWEHTMLVVDEAAKRKAQSTDSRVFMWAALLHDMGKPATTRSRNGRITAYNHDRVGAEAAEKMLLSLTSDAEFSRETAMLILYHMQPLYVEKNLPFKNIPGMERDTDVRDVALLGLCDRLGRKGADPREVEAGIADFLKKCGAENPGGL